MADSVASELETLHSDVGAQPTVLASLEALFHGLCARLKHAIRMGLASDASDAHLAPFQDLLTGLESRGPDLAAAVMANTPHVEPSSDAPDHSSDNQEAGPGVYGHISATAPMPSPEHQEAIHTPEGVSTADDAPLPGHDPNEPGKVLPSIADEVPFAERVKPPIRTEVGSNYIPAPIAPGNPVTEPVEPPVAEPASVESAPADAAQAHDQHGAQAEANVAAHANDHDAKKPAADA